MEKIILNYSASGQRLKPLYSLQKFASDTVNYAEAVFDLDESWAFNSVRAIWVAGTTCISTVLDQDGVCTVPQEVMQKKAKVEVNLVGSNVENDQLVDRLTTYPVQAFIVDSDVPICGSETAEITPSQFEQFVQIVTTEVAKIRDVDRVELNDDYTITFYYSDGTESPKIGPIRGEQGADGIGIQSIAKIGSEGRIDTYRIAYTNGGHFDFNVTNGEKGDRGEQGETGNGIDRIEKTETVGSVDTYTIYFTDGSTTTFDVTNGEVTKAELESLLPTETASGSIVSFPDGQSVFPMKSLKVNLEPIQDLHGYDKPWVGGAGANLLDVDSRVSQTTAGVTYTSDKDFITLNGTKSGGSYATMNGLTITLGAGTYYAKAFVISGSTTSSVGLYAYINGSDTSSLLSGERTITLTEETTIGFRFGLWTDGGTFTNYKVGIVVSKTSGITEWTPYSNICPIYGHDSVGANVSGVNVWNEECEQGGIAGGTGQPQSDNTRIRPTDFISVCENTTYYAKAPTNIDLFWYDINKAFIRRDSAMQNFVATSPSNAKYMKFQCGYSGYPLTPSTYNHDISINYPSTDHDYHAYEGDTYTANLPQTVYGGYADLIKGAADSKDAKGYVDLGTLNWSKYTADTTGHSFYCSIPSNAKTVPNNNTLINALCSQYDIETFSSVSSWTQKDGALTQVEGPQRWIVRDTRYTDATTFKTAMNGVQLCYEKATPTDINIQGQPITTLYGRNNVWSEDGDVDVTYKADIQLYIDKKTNELAVAIAAL